ncbi:ThiF family [Fragilaria crotonensis]|nr:ThiF family [Fragilaria crotonensis]
MERLRGAKIVVVGLGGVGSHAAHMLARSGVGHLRMIDFDQVSLSSLNRHACATLADVGTPKASCMKRFCERLCPDPEYLVLEDIVQMYTAETGPQLLDGHDWDLVIDAIDDIPTKAALLAQCMKLNVRVISCMGAGGKSDVTRLHISDLRTASRDPLASKLRQSIKRLLHGDTSYMDDMEKLTVVYSSEKTVVKLADFTDEQKEQGVHQFGAVDGMRIRIIPVLGTMPAVMGQTLAATALCELEISLSPLSLENELVAMFGTVFFNTRSGAS